LLRNLREEFAIALAVYWDCMEPWFREGDLVWFDRELPA
jgi:hypothetical protein